MTRYLAKRILNLIPTLFGITLVSFLLMQLAPGGPVDLMTDMNPSITAEAKARIRKDLGLDRPMHIQYAKWLQHIAHLDFGLSFTDRRPAWNKIMERLPATLLLNFLSIGVMVILAIPIGIWSAVKSGTWGDRVLTIFVFLGFSMPTYALALALMVLFGLRLGWLPVSGLSSLNFLEAPWYVHFWDMGKHLILPVAVLGLTALAGLSRYMRTTMLEVLGQDFIRAARAKGLKERRVIGVNALRNALIPLVTLFGLMLPDFIGGSVIIETIFAYPGMGRLGYDAIMSRDYNVIMALTVITAVLTVLGNLVADLLYASVDPRIRYR